MRPLEGDIEGGKYIFGMLTLGRIGSKNGRLENKRGILKKSIKGVLNLGRESLQIPEVSESLRSVSPGL